MSALSVEARIAAARALLEQINPTVADRAFVEALTMAARGDAAGAIAALEAMLVTTPGHVLTRRELARLYAQTGQIARARAEYRVLARTDPDRARRIAHRREEQALRAQQALSFTGVLALVPTSNVNQGSRNATFATTQGPFTVGAASRPDRALGVRVGGTVTANVVRAPRQSASLSAGVTALLYDERRLDEEVGTFALRTTTLRTTRLRGADGGEGQAATARHGFGLVRTFVREGGEASYKAWQLDLSRQAPLTMRTGLVLDLHRQWRSYDVDVASDGVDNWGGATVTRTLTSDRTGWARVELRRNDRVSDAVSYDERSLTLGFRQQFDTGLSLSGSLRYGDRTFRGTPQNAFAPRSDQTTDVTVTARSTEIEYDGWVPELRCRITRNRSNFGLFSYDEETCTVQITTGF